MRFARATGTHLPPLLARVFLDALLPLAVACLVVSFLADPSRIDTRELRANSLLMNTSQLFRQESNPFAAAVGSSAILILAASAFHWSGHQDVAEIQDAFRLLSPLLGVSGASALFAIALLASGQNSTLTGTLAGQIVMEGFLNFRIAPWLRRVITRGLAIIPAVLVIGIFGEGETTKLLIASQVVLSMQLGFAVWPLMRFTGEKRKMGEFANGFWIKLFGWTSTLLIITLNVKLLLDTFLPSAWTAAFYGALGLPAP